MLPSEKIADEYVPNANEDGKGRSFLPEDSPEFEEVVQEVLHELIGDTTDSDSDSECSDDHWLAIVTEECNKDKEKLRNLYEKGKAECQRNNERYPDDDMPDKFVTKAEWDAAVEALDMARRHWVDDFLLSLGYDRMIEYSCDSDCSCEK